MKSAATRTARPKKTEEEGKEPKTTTKGTKTKSTTSKAPGLSRSKTDVAAKKSAAGKPSKLAGISIRDVEKLPAYMRPTQSSLQTKTSGANEETGDGTGKIITRGAAGKSGSKKKGTKTTDAAAPTKTKKPLKKTKTKKTSEKSEKSPVPDVETPTPVEVSTETAVDGSAVVGLAPATPQTPGQDPVTHISDNDSTEAAKETPGAQSKSEDGVPFEVAEVVEEEGGPSEPVEGANLKEPEESIKHDALVAEKLVTTETAVVLDTSDEEDEEPREVEEDPMTVDAPVEPSSSDPPNAEAMESAVEVTTEDAGIDGPPATEADPVVPERPADAPQDKTPAELPCEEDPKELAVPPPAVGKGQETDPQEPKPETENKAIANTDPKEEASTPPATAADPATSTTAAASSTAPADAE